MHNNSQTSVFALIKQGAGAAAPAKKKRRCHPEGASADDSAPEGSRDVRVVPRTSRCCAKKSAMNNRKMNDKELCYLM